MAVEDSSKARGASGNERSVRQVQVKALFCAGSVLLRYSTEAKKGLDAAIAHETFISGCAPMGP